MYEQLTTAGTTRYPRERDSVVRDDAPERFSMTAALKSLRHANDRLCAHLSTVRMIGDSLEGSFPETGGAEKPIEHGNLLDAYSYEIQRQHALIEAIEYETGRVHRALGV